MRVALVHDWLTGMRGGEKVLEQISLLFPEAPIYTLFHFPGSVSSQLESHPIITSSLQHLPGVKKNYRTFLPLFPRAAEAFDLTDFDVVISTSHCVAKGVRPAASAVHLCYCHTPMRYAWDQQRAYFPKTTGPVAKVRDYLLSRLRIWDVESSLRTDLFVANSTFVADRIRRYYARSSVVVPPPVDTEAFSFEPPASTSGDDGTTPSYLMVAALAPYKRVDTTIQACAQADVELRIVGDGPERARLEELAKQLGAKVAFLGRISEDELRSEYRTATAYLQPGIEDFGISTVEALACGTPVLAFGRGGVCDIVRPGIDGWLYQEDSPEALADTISKSHQEKFNRLDLRQRAETFSNARFRELFQATLDQLLQETRQVS